MSKASDKFINLNLNHKSLDLFFVRMSILKAIKEKVLDFKGELLDIGCGKMPYKDYIVANSNITDYIGLDIETAIIYDADIKPDYIWNGITMPFKDSVFNNAFGTEVLEHCPEPEIVLKEVLRVLKPGGTFFFTVPFLWNLHETPHDEYRYTPYSLERHLSNVGFRDIEIKATGGWHASLAQMLGLWVRRSPMKPRRREFLSRLLKPVIKFLIKRDETKNIQFNEGQMITGLYGTAKK